MAAPGIKTSTVKAINNLESMWAQVESIKTQMDGECLHERPANSFTKREFCDRFRVSESTARGQIERMIRNGRLREARVLMPDKNGRVVPHNVYIPVDVAAERAPERPNGKIAVSLTYTGRGRPLPLSDYE